MFLVATGTFLVAPLLPALSRKFGIGEATSGWMVSSYAIGYCVTTLISGPLSDRFNRKHVLTVGMFLFAVGTFSCGLATSFAGMLALRFLTGAAAAVGSPQIWAAIPQLVPRKHLVSAMAAPTTGLTVAQLAGVPLGSFLSARSPSDPFFAVGGAALLLAIVVALWFPFVPTPEHPADEPRTSLFAPYVSLWHTPNARGRFSAYLLFQIGNFAIMSFASTWFSKSFALTTNGIGIAMLVLGVGNTAGALFGPRIVAHLSSSRTLAGALTCYLIGYILLPLNSNIVGACAVLCRTFCIGGIIFPVFQTLLQSLTVTARGTVSALTNMHMYAGSTIAGILGGPLLTALPGFWGICLVALVTIAGSFCVWAASGALTPTAKPQ